MDKFVLLLILLSANIVNPKKFWQYFERTKATDLFKRIHRQDNFCGSTLDLIDCDINHPLSFRRREENRFRAKYVPGKNCNIQRSVFDWFLYFANGSDFQFNDYYNRDIFVIIPYTIGTGDHSINVFVREIHKDSTMTDIGSEPCIFSIKPEAPIPQITGGSEIIANSDEAFIVSGRESTDVNVAPGLPGNLEFKWNCTVTGTASDFCMRNLGRGSSITIPKSEAKQGSVYTITLSVRTSETDWYSTKQTVHFMTGVTVMEIRCLRNCPPAAQKTNGKENVIVQANCKKYCKGLEKEHYEWSINIPGFDYEKNTKGGRNSDVFHINKNVMEPGNNYLVTVILKGMSGRSSIEIDVHVPPKLTACTISPPKGEALKTKFTATCHHPPGDYMFEIYSVRNDIGVIIEKGMRLEELPFLLGPDSQVKIKIIDSYRFSDEKLLNVQVTSFLKMAGSQDAIEEDILNKYFKSEFSITELMEMRHFEDALKVTDSLASDMENLLKSGKHEIAQKYSSLVLNLLEEVPIDTDIRARQLSSLATKITDMFSSKPDPEVAASGTKICKRSAELMLKRLKLKRFPESFSEETRESASTLSKCGNAGAKPNLEILESEIIAPTISTPFPLLNIPVIKEDYPDYVDDQNTSYAMNKFDETTNNLIKLCIINSKKLAIEMSTQDKTMFIEVDFFNLTSTKKSASDLAETIIQSHKVTLIPSADFSGKSSIHTVMCTTTKNIFWWSQKEIFSSIAIIEFNVNDRPVKKFKKPFTLSFQTQDNKQTETKSYEHKTPQEVDAYVPDVEYDFERLSIHRIGAYGDQSFVIEFQDLPDDMILDVVVADFHKPSMEEFKQKAVEIHTHKNKLFIQNKKYYDSWYYLAVLPRAKINYTVNYKFSVYTLSCVRWAEREAKWKFACASTEDSTKRNVICKCYRTSTLTAMLFNNEVRLEETLSEELLLEIQASYIIFGSVAVIFLLYCIFFTWFSITNVRERVVPTVYFLSDVPNSYRYGYVLIVKTGNKSNAGTTSNVTVKIYGTKSESKEHVLNYPDPEKRFLQKNQDDWFFMATEYYLGDIEKIDIWFDSIGYRPAWFCTEIEVFDIQQNKYWRFEINKWFEVLRHEKIVYTAFPSIPQERKMDKMKDLPVTIVDVLRKCKNSSRGPHMWNLIRYEEHAISRMERLHVVYSIFLMIYTMGMYLYGCPKLQNSDSLSYTLHYGIDKYVIFYTFGCFIITFTLHFPIVWFFRYPNDDIFRNWKHHAVFKKYKINTSFLCWFFLVSNIISSMSLLIVLGFWIPHITDLLWLTTIILSVLVYVLVMENILRVILNFSINQKARIQNIFQQIRSSLSTIEKQRAMLYKSFGAVILRPFFDHLYKPMDVFKIKEQRYWAARKEKLWEILEDLIMITIYVTLLYLVILMDRDPVTLLSHLEATELVTGVHSRTVLLDDVMHRKELEDFINDTLIFSMQSLQWYGNYVTKNPGMTIDKANKYLGVARLRQHRTYNVICTANITGESKCYPPFSLNSETRNFSEGWNSNKLSNRFARMDAIWDYIDAWHAGTVKYVGSLATYPGGGYITPLGRTLQNSIINFNYLIRNHWVDRLSRCVFVEFLMYNPCNNLFNSVRIKFEISTTGYIKSNLDIHTAKLLFVKEETDLIVWTVLVSFIVMVIILAIKLSHRLIHKGKILLKDIWHVVDIIIIIMSLVCLGLYIARSNLVSSFLLRIEKARNNEFINYFHLMYTERILTIMAAILVFVATLRLWKLMRFMTVVKVVEKTLISSVPALLGLFLYQVIFILACTFYGVLKYGHLSSDFKSILDSIMALIILSLDLYEEFDFDVIDNQTGYIYYSVLMLVMLCIYTLYIAVITISYENARLYYSGQENYNVMDYTREQCRYIREVLKVKWKNCRLRGGDGRGFLNEYVYPKADEFRYANSVTLPSNKMDGMIHVTRCVLRNMKGSRESKISDKDVDLIKHTIVNLNMEDTEEQEIFFICNIKGQKVRFVDDRILLKMKMVVESFLEANKESIEKDRRRKLCKKIMESHQQKMNDIEDMLNAVLDTINVVNIDVGSDTE